MFEGGLDVYDRVGCDTDLERQRIIRLAPGSKLTILLIPIDNPMISFIQVKPVSQHFVSDKKESK